MLLLLFVIQGWSIETSTSRHKEGIGAAAKRDRLAGILLPIAQSRAMQLWGAQNAYDGAACREYRRAEVALFAKHSLCYLLWPLLWSSRARIGMHL